MESRKYKYECSCGNVYHSDFPYKCGECLNCGNKVYIKPFQDMLNAFNEMQDFLNKARQEAKVK